MNKYYFTTIIFGYPITIIEEDNYIVGLILGNVPPTCMLKETKLIREAIIELDEYFNRKRTSFDIPIKFHGTTFQNKVWMEMRNIPYGSVLSYGEIAEKIGYPKASRAVGNACNKNPIFILVPCHRVVAKNGIGGYGGNLGLKIRLLELEGAI